MTDPLDLTLPNLDEPIVEFDMHGLVIPSPEYEPEPIWKTPAELAEGKRLIARIKADIPKLDAELARSQGSELSA